MRPDRYAIFEDVDVALSLSYATRLHCGPDKMTYYGGYTVQYVLTPGE